MKKFLLILTLSVGICQAQVYTAAKNTALTTAAEVVTIQQPATGSRQVTFISVYFDCSVACQFTLERNGTAASSTSLAVKNVNPNETAPSSVAWSSSNVGVGTTIGIYNCASACALSIDLTGVAFSQGSTAGTNITMRSNSITGTVDVIFKFKEASI